jgi:hypothetical protein
MKTSVIGIGLLRNSAQCIRCQSITGKATIIRRDAGDSATDYRVPVCDPCGASEAVVMADFMLALNNARRLEQRTIRPYRWRRCAA